MAHYHPHCAVLHKIQHGRVHAGSHGWAKLMGATLDSRSSATRLLLSPTPFMAAMKANQRKHET